jgi:hypothetical protein
MNLGLAHCLDLWLNCINYKLNKNTKFVIKGLIWNTKKSDLFFVLHCKPNMHKAQRGERIRVGAREGFAYHSVKVTSVANDNRYKVWFQYIFSKGQSPLSIYNIALSQSDLFFDTHSVRN